MFSRQQELPWPNFDRPSDHVSIAIMAHIRARPGIFETEKAVLLDAQPTLVVVEPSA